MPFCTNCGAQLSSTMKYCPECGAKVSSAIDNEIEDEEEGLVSLRIARSKKGAAMAVKADVFIDGASVGSVSYGGAFVVSVLPGEHTLYITIKGSGSSSDVINIPEDATEAEYIFRVAGLDCHPERVRFQSDGSDEMLRSRSIPARQANVSPSANRCPRCGGVMTIQAVTESRKSGCGTVLLYIILALTIFGLLIVIPLALRSKTETMTYSVCQRCGYRKKLGRL